MVPEHGARARCPSTVPEHGARARCPNTMPEYDSRWVPMWKHLFFSKHSHQNRPYSYSRYWTGTSLQPRLKLGVFSNANDVFFFVFVFLMIFPRVSLNATVFCAGTQRPVLGHQLWAQPKFFFSDNLSAKSLISTNSYAISNFTDLSVVPQLTAKFSQHDFLALFFNHGILHRSFPFKDFSEFASRV